VKFEFVFESTTTGQENLTFKHDAAVENVLLCWSESPCFYLKAINHHVFSLCLLDGREIKRQSLFGNHALLYLETKGALSESIQNAFLLAYFYHLLFELILGNFDQGRLRGPSVHGRLSS